MKKKLLLVLAFIMAAMLLVAGCSSKSASDERMPSGDAGYVAPQVEEDYDGTANYTKGEYQENISYDTATTDDASARSKFQEKIIYNVNMSLECDDVDAAVDGISDTAKSMGGYVSYANSYKSGGDRYASLQVRVPSEKLDEVISYVKTLGDVPSENMSTEDITDQYYDIVTRLAHEEKQEEQLLELLDKAETIEDILLVRAQLDSVQANIESYKGTIKRWDSLVDYSTVDISLSPTPSLDTDDGDGMRLISLGETGRAMVRVFKQSAIFVANAFSLLLRVLSALIIPAAIIAPIVLLIVFLAKRANRKRNQNNVDK